MKVKNLKNAVSSSIIENKIKKNLYQFISSDVETKSIANEVFETDLENVIQNNNLKVAFFNKIPKALSTHSKYIKNLSNNIIIGPVVLKVYTNKNILINTVLKKNEKEKSLWLIRINNFFIIMPKETPFVWKYDVTAKQVALKTESLISLYLLPMPLFVNFSFNSLKDTYLDF